MYGPLRLIIVKDDVFIYLFTIMIDILVKEDDIGDLQVSPFTEYGAPIEIVEGIFGGREKYLQVVREIERQLYN